MLIDKDLIRLLRVSKNAIAWIGLNALCRFLSLAVSIAIVALIARTAGSVYAGGNVSGDLPGLALILGMLVVAKIGLAFLSGEFSFRTAAGIKAGLRDRLFDKLIELDAGNREGRGTSSIVSLAVDGVEALETYYGRYLPQLAYCIAAPVLLFLYVSTLSLPSALVLVAAVPAIPASMLLVGRRAKKITGRYWDSYEKLSAYFLESLQGLPTLKMFGREDDRKRDFAKAAWTFRDNTMRVLRIQLLSLLAMDFVAYAGAAAGILVAAFSLRSGLLTIEGALAVLFLAPEFFLPFRALGSYYHSGMAGFLAGKKIMRFLESRPAIDKKAPGMPGGKFSDVVPGIDFEGVRFSYDGSRDALCDFSISVKAKGCVAIAGKSGSGKSTVGKLCVRFHDPDRGKVMIGGIDLRKISPGEIRSMITVVSQNSYIFTGSIADNLKIAKPDATADEMLDVCRKAGMGSYVCSLRDGLDTPVGEWGRLMSGGQRQRLAMARAILRDTPVYVFDEATSNVDSVTEEKMWESIHALTKDRTSIIISHRLSAIRNADRIFMMDSGRVVEEGSHDDLMSAGGVYAQMVKEQECLESIFEWNVGPGMRKEAGVTGQ